MKSFLFKRVDIFISKDFTLIKSSKVLIPWSLNRKAISWNLFISLAKK